MLFFKKKFLMFFVPVGNYLWHYVFSVVAMMSPEDSWVAKWQRIGENVSLINNNDGFLYMISTK